MSKEESGPGVRSWESELPPSRTEGVDAQQEEDKSSARAWELVEARPYG